MRVLLCTVTKRGTPLSKGPEEEGTTHFIQLRANVHLPSVTHQGKIAHFHCFQYNGKR